MTRASCGLSRSWSPFVVGRRTLLFAGMITRVYPGNGGTCPALHPVPFFGNRLFNSAKPAQRDDDSEADSCSCPSPTVLGGVPNRVPGYRRLSPLHTDDRQATGMGDTLSPQHLRGGNHTHTEYQVIHVAGTVPTTCLPVPRSRRFRANGSHSAMVVDQHDAHGKAPLCCGWPVSPPRGMVLSTRRKDGLLSQALVCDLIAGCYSGQRGD